MTKTITPGGSFVATSRRVMRDVPERWCVSELTKFFDLIENNGIASFVGMQQLFEVLEGIDEALISNTPKIFHQVEGSQVISARLYARAFSAYRAAARLAVGGQVYESVTLRRSILEHAVYAWACGHSQTHRDAWIARPVGAPERKSVRNLFRWSSLMKLLATVDKQLQQNIGVDYDYSIDFGAHPNVEGVDLSSAFIESGARETTINTFYAHGQDAIALAMIDIISTMHLVYQLLTHSVGHRLRILSIDQQFDFENQRFIAFVKDRQLRADRSAKGN
jgi:hypothetical protein